MHNWEKDEREWQLWCCSTCGASVRTLYGQHPREHIKGRREIVDDFCDPQRDVIFELVRRVKIIALSILSDPAFSRWFREHKKRQKNPSI